MKKGWLALFAISLISLASAYMPYSNFNINIPIMALMFLILAALINYSLMKFIEDKTTRLIITFSASALAIFWGIKNGMSFENIFSNLGILDFITKAAPTLIVILFILLMFFWNIGAVIMAIGGMFTLIGLIGSITEMVYNWEFSIFLGVILFLFGLWIYKRSQKKKDKTKDEKNTEKEIKDLKGEIKDLKDEIEKEKNKPEGIKNRNRLARLIGIKKLERTLLEKDKILDEGYEKARKLFQEANKLGWTKAGIKRRKNEVIKKGDTEETIRKKDRIHKKRAYEASEAYKAWYRQIQKNETLKKEILQIKTRIRQLKNRT